jgi:hypothetical protein
MDGSETIFLGLDLAAVLTLPTVLALFGFAVWWGVTRCSVGIDEEEQARRMEVPGRF